MSYKNSSQREHKFFQAFKMLSAIVLLLFISKNFGSLKKNRNPASVCYNEGAVELGTANKKEEKLDKDQTYINANHLRSPLGHYILAQVSKTHLHSSKVNKRIRSVSLCQT